jgi:hypothetical protein
MRSKLIVKTLHLNTLKQEVQPDTVGLLIKIHCLPDVRKTASQLQRPANE